MEHQHKTVLATQILIRSCGIQLDEKSNSQSMAPEPDTLTAAPITRQEIET